MQPWLLWLGLVPATTATVAFSRTVSGLTFTVPVALTPMYLSAAFADEAKVPAAITARREIAITFLARVILMRSASHKIPASHPII